MRIAIDTFSGIVPKASPRLLAASQAQIARNARLASGDLEAWNAAITTATLEKTGIIRSLYLFDDQHWFHWNEVVHAVRGPVPDDTSQRTYFTGFGRPRFTDLELALAGSSEAYPVNSYELGVPAPESGLSASVGGTVTEDDPALIETRAYVYTYVSRYGEEGPPSPPSNYVDVSPGNHVDVDGIAPVSGQVLIETARIYRSASSGATSAYQFVAEVPIGQSTYRDEIDNNALGEVLPSEDWIAPPEDMHSLVALPNGVLAGASGLDIVISEQYVPHAWPLDYRHTADDEVVGLGVIGNSLIVLTGKAPYLVTGASPQSMTMSRIGSDEFACVAGRAVATLPGLGVVFPTPDGLGAITSSGTANLTAAYMDKREWQAYAPESMHAVAHQGRYFAFYDTGTRRGCLVFDPVESDNALYELDLIADASYRDPRTDTLYLAVNGQVQAWDAGQAPGPAYVWRSKRYELPTPAVLAAARLRAADYADVTMRVFMEGALVAEVVVASDAPIRLPIRSRGRVYEIELTGTSRVFDVQVAESMDELN